MVKKIALLYDFFSEHGGVERIMLFQARALKKAGFQVSFAFAYVDENLKKERLSEFEVIEYAKLPVKNETLQICSSILRDSTAEKFKKFDLLICHSFPSSYLALRVKKKFKIPYIIHLHHPPQFLYTADLNWARNSFKRKFSFAAGKIFNSSLKKFDFKCVQNAESYFLECETVRRIVKNTYGIDGIVLYPTIGKDFALRKHNLKELEKYGIKKDYVLGSGRIVPQKKFDFLIKAFSMLKEKNLQLVLVGKYDDKTRIELKNLASAHNIKILFLGPVEISELIKIYNLAKTTVLTCPKEWFGIVPIESMACGCPVVAWKDCSGPQETIIEGKNGFLAKPYEVSDLAEKIGRAVKKRWDKKEIITSVEKFSEESQAKVLIDALKKFQF